MRKRLEFSVSRLNDVDTQQAAIEELRESEALAVYPVVQFAFLCGWSVGRLFSIWLRVRLPLLAQ